MPSQIALAWVLKRSPVMLPIPGTSKVKHLEENVAAVNVELTDEEFAATRSRGPRRLGSGLTARHLPAGTTGLPVRWP